MEGNCSYKDRLIGFIADYEEVLLGKKGKYSFWYCTGNTEYDEKLALDVMRYAFEKLLKWTPEMINECKDIAVLEKMKLYYIYKQKIIHPYRKTQFSIFNLIASKMYPEKITLDGKSNTISIYKKVLSGEYVKFPKNFFSTTEGILKFGYCLRYALTEIIGFTSAKELYDMFSEPSIKTVLEKIKLLNVFSLFFETPVDMLHYCIPKALRDDNYYIICKQKYLKKRLSCGTGLRYVRQYHRYLYCQDSYNPLTGLGEEYREEPSRIIFYYVLTELLPADPALKYEKYDYQDRNTLYCIMTRYDIDYISRFINASGRPNSREAQYGYYSNGRRTGTNWAKYNRDLASWMESVINSLDYPPDYIISIPTPNSSSSYSSTIDSYRMELVGKMRDDDGSFQRDAREEYNNTNASQYQQYLNAIDMFDTGSGALEFDLNKPCDTDIETDNFSTEDDTDALLWYLWLTYGWTDIPSGVKVRTVTDFIGDRSVSEPILAFRVWLIRKGIYLNDSWSSGNGYTLNQEIWNNGELLTYWVKVYGGGYGECIDSCISPYERKYPDEYREITGRTGNDMNDDLYPYLEGYTNASYIPYKSTKVEDYSIFDNAITLFGKLGLDGGQNIPANKWLDLGFYTDIEVVKYSNDNLIKSGVYDRYEWYVYYNPNGNDRNSAEVVFHDSSTSRDCPYTAIAEGYYWVECYQSGFSTYEEKYTYNKTNFLVEETTGTVLMTSFVPQIQTRTNTITLPEKVKLLSEEAGYLNNNSMTWRAQNGRIIASFNTERRSDMR